MEKTLLEQAEEARQKGNRSVYLALKAEHDAEQEKAVQVQHKKRVEAVSKEFPVGKYIPELGATVKHIKDGCGTQRGGIDIYLSEKEKFSPEELRRKIYVAKESARVTEKFRGLKFPRHGRCYVGQYTEGLDDLITFMDMKRIWTLQRWDDENAGSFFESYEYAYNEAVKDGYTNTEAEEKGQEAESEARDEAFEEYERKVKEAVNYLLQFCDLELTEAKQGKYYIAPLHGWKESADKMAEIITGYGMFEYANGQALKDTLPAKTYSEAVIVHLHWLVKAPEVYGGRGYDYMMR